MEQFAIGITSDTPQETRDKLDAAGVPTIGPAYGKFMRAPDAEWTPGDSMTAVLSCESGEYAAQRVREALGDECQLDEPRRFGQ